MEVLDIYDDLGHKTGKTNIRGTKVEGGNVMIALAIIKNSKGEFLIQKRSKIKNGDFGFTGGHVMHGEDSLTAIQREVKEELGVILDKSSIKYVAMDKNPSRLCLISIYQIDADLNVTNLKLQKEEVENVAYLDQDNIMKIINANKFLESHAFVFKKYFANK